MVGATIALSIYNVSVLIFNVDRKTPDALKTLPLSTIGLMQYRFTEVNLLVNSTKGRWVNLTTC